MQDAKAVPDDKAQIDKALSTIIHCHCDCTAVPPPIALLPPLPIAIMLPPLPSPIAAAAMHGDCHCAVAAVLPSIAPPPLMPIGIMPPLLLSPIMTPAVAHHHHRCPSPPPSPITITLPSCHPLRIHRRHPLPLRCHCATLYHLLMLRCPSTCQLVVMLDWLSFCHLSSCHHLSMHRLVTTSPLNAPPSSLPWLVVASPCRCHCLSTHRLVVTLPLIPPPSCSPRLVVLAPIVAPPPLIALAGCHVASHCATLSFDLADFCTTHCRCHHHPSQSRCHPVVHCAVTTIAHRDYAANVESHHVTVLPSFPSPPPTIIAIATPHFTIALTFCRCCATSTSAVAAAAAAAGGGTAATAAVSATTGSSLGALPPHETS
jgi:hypothetical protein